ncbi:MAG: hypothetical protein KF716_14230 [Anaerolineae bacterium]|nr:hypothetical protein [Anaerolineae bacterium]
MSNPNDPKARVFKLIHAGRKGLGNSVQQYTVVITPEPIEWPKVRNAWTHAVRFSAKGLDLPDYPAALELLKQRHPSWDIIDSYVIDVQWNTSEAGEDVPDA